MSRRVVLAIGCDRYAHLTPLNGAEVDARRMFEVLTDPDKGGYDAAGSRLLLSPQLSEVMKALADIFADLTPIDSFTFVFAGHGAVKNGSFYMAVSNSQYGLLSGSALPLGQLFTMLGEQAPAQSNIIIDACESGGLIADLNALLKPENLGAVGTPGITLLATSARNQSAGDTPSGGIGTNAVLDCINGATFIDDTSPFLDLIDIGRAVSVALYDTPEQSPVVWGLNLFGPKRFCRNPRTDADAVARASLASWPHSVASDSMRLQMPALWRLYAGLEHDWDSRAFLDAMAPLLDTLQGEPDQQRALIERFLDPAVLKASALADGFIPVEVAATGVVATLPFAEAIGSLEGGDVLLERVVTQVENTLDAIWADVEADRFALMRSRDGLAGLFYLPLRISRILGWAGLAHLYRSGFEEDSASRLRLERISHAILEHYALSVVFMSETQAPFIAVWLSAIKKSCLEPIGERVLRTLSVSMLQTGAKSASASIEPEQVFDYLLARSAGDFSEASQLCARPSEFALMLIRASTWFGLEGEVDQAMHLMDRESLIAFLPRRLDQFAEDLMQDGSSIVFRVGFDVWTVAEIESAWPQEAVVQPAGNAEHFRCLLAALLFPNRVPWFLFSPPTP
ncbi:caspase family protein [Asticcacaulis machinosus]|uniref:Caspase family protein n=1 Tax=Asticcacaulis machinosus TaxID=2984211 RepID=A0ABT5HH84_9CAUL|nr:caspase family protein [Asticcacaulis machinosus]MDC7675552.1 caspase family protein [Asticcacaulis machinosus]